MALTEEQMARFLSGRRNAVLGLNRKDGPPQLTPVWYLWTGEHFEITTTRERAKWFNLQRDKRVSLCIDDAMWFTYVSVEGQAEIVADESIWPRIRAIIDRYIDQPYADRMYARVRGEPRVLLRVHPEKWQSFDITYRVLMSK